MTKSDKIRALLTRNPKLTVAEVADKLGVSKVTVYAVRGRMVPVEVVAEPTLPAVDTHQVGGNHYTKLAIQPWEVIENNQMGFFDGNALKYIMRFRAKGGVQDLEKARHYLDKLIELEHGRNA
jgi:hypothetical protein